MDEFNEILKAHKLPLALSLVGVVLILGGIFSSRQTIKPKVSNQATAPVSTNYPYSIKVDVAGAVNAPGVYSLTGSSRVEDAIIAAGGISDSANHRFVSKNLNLSQRLTDGEKIYIPFVGDDTGGASSGSATSVSAKVSLNSASEADLDSLPGVGPVTAQKIIDNRSYNSVEDLLTKKVVSQSVYNKIKDLVQVN